MFQALGGCSGTVAGRVIVRDQFDQRTQAAMLSRISMGMALSPIVAPLAGSLIDAALGWRWLFVGLGLLATVSLAMTGLLLPETRPVKPRPISGAPTVVCSAIAIFCAMRWRSALSAALFPVCRRIVGPPARTMHLSATVYALVFGLTVTGYVGGSHGFRRLSASHSADRLISGAVLLNIAGAVMLMSATTLFPDSITAIVLPFIVIMLSVGVAIPACQFRVLQPYASITGSASGLFFFIQMALTAMCSLVTCRLSDGSAAPMVYITLGSSGIWRRMAGRRQGRRQNPVYQLRWSAPHQQPADGSRFHMAGREASQRRASLPSQNAGCAERSTDSKRKAEKSNTRPTVCASAL
jgi:DHA1 family bicyclomycin/chloramphenicol resistance-like MFS transporter